MTREELDREWNAAEFMDHREESLIDGKDTRDRQLAIPKEFPSR